MWKRNANPSLSLSHWRNCCRRLIDQGRLEKHAASGRLRPFLWYSTGCSRCSSVCLVDLYVWHWSWFMTLISHVLSGALWVWTWECKSMISVCDLLKQWGLRLALKLLSYRRIRWGIKPVWLACWHLLTLLKLIKIQFIWSWLETCQNLHCSAFSGF